MYVCTYIYKMSTHLVSLLAADGNEDDLAVTADILC